MSRAHYYHAGRTMIMVTFLGMTLTATFATVAIHEQDWYIMAIALFGFLINYTVFALVLADGIKRFGDRHYNDL